jgi:hypothetical protein
MRDAKIAANGGHVGLSFHAFFANKNHDPKQNLPPTSSLYVPGTS